MTSSYSSSPSATITLLNSPIYRDATRSDENYLPALGLGYIATALRAAHIGVELVDCVSERLGVMDALRVIEESQPDWVGLNVFSQNLEIVREIVARMPSATKIMIGGPAAGGLYPHLLRWRESGELAVVVGEADFIAADLVRGTIREPARYVDGDRRVFVVDKASIYFPRDLGQTKLDHSLLKRELVINHFGMQEASIITSRGCPYNCAYCGAARDMNRDTLTRIRLPHDIRLEIDELRDLHPQLGSIRILDDLFLRNRASFSVATGVFSAVAALEWRAMAHVLPVTRSIDLLPDIKLSGCRELFIGMESGSPGVRQAINKQGAVEDVYKAVTSLMELGIDVKGYFICGFPGENERDCDFTLRLAERIKAASAGLAGSFRPSVFQFRPYHGTRLYDDLVDKGVPVGPIVPNPRPDTPSRAQFNFHAGNFSSISDERLAWYIRRIQQL